MLKTKLLSPTTSIDKTPDWGRLIGHIPFRKSLLGTPILVRKTGDIYVLGNHKKLFLGFELEDEDMIIVDTHGEIIPAIALALRQDLFRNVEDPSIMHIDARHDAAGSRTVNYSIYNPKTQLYHLNRRTITSEQIRIAIQDFIETPEQKASNKFQRLIRLSHRDVETFLKALATFFPQIGAAIRKPNTDTTLIYPPSADYLTDSPTSPDPLSKIIAENRFSIYSIDADFCACIKEDKENNNLELFQKRLNFLLDALQHEITKKSESPEYPTLYTVSLDPVFCKYPVEFIKAFIEKFYIPLIQGNTREKAQKVAH